MKEINEWLRPHFNNEDVFEMRDYMMDKFQFGKEVKHLIFNKFEG